MTLAVPVAAGAAPITLASVTPATVAAPGVATVVFRVAGGAVDATASIVIRGSELAKSTVSDEVESLDILSAGLSGKGSLAFAMPPLAAYAQGCERGGIAPASSVDAYTLSIPAHAVSALVVRVRVPRGFAWHTPELQVSSGALTPVGQTRAPRDEATDDLVKAPLPRTGPTLDGLQMAVSAGTDTNSYVARGHLYPARAGAMIRIVGAPSPDWPPAPQVTTDAVQALGAFQNAMAPISPQFAAYAKTRTNAAGRWAVRFTAPRGTMIVARSRGTAGVTDAGASCPVQLGD